MPAGELMSIYDASIRYKDQGIPVIVLAGRDYGMGSSRDWAAKGTLLLGIKAVIAQSFERIHRSNLIGMGVLPLQFKAGQSAQSLGLTGKESYTIEIDDNLKPGQDVTVHIEDDGGSTKIFSAACRIDTQVEIEYYGNGGILHTVLRNILRQEQETGKGENRE